MIPSHTYSRAFIQPRLHSFVSSFAVPDACQTSNPRMLTHYQPNTPPPPPPILPPLLASFNSHSLKNSSFFISSGFVNLVSNCASCRLNANNVGILAICLPISTFPHNHPNRSTHPKLHWQILNQRRIHLHLHIPQPALSFPYFLLFNHL